MSIELNVGDRVEYPDIMRFQLGNQRTNEQGEVVDIVRGEAGRLVVVASKPDNPFQVNTDGAVLRIDFLDTDDGAQHVIRKVGQE